MSTFAFIEFKLSFQISHQSFKQERSEDNSWGELDSIIDMID